MHPAKKRIVRTITSNYAAHEQNTHVRKTKMLAHKFGTTRKAGAWEEVARVGINLALLGMIGGVVGTAISMKAAVERNGLSIVENQIMSNAVNTSAALFWPVLFDFTVGFHQLVDQPKLLMGFLWTPVITCFELTSTMDQLPITDGEARRNNRELNADAQAVISAAFAMGALMAGIRSRRGTNIIMYALILSLALVIPNINNTKKTMGRMLVQTLQKQALNYAIGFLVAGITSELLKNDVPIPKTKAPLRTSMKQ